MEDLGVLAGVLFGVLFWLLLAALIALYVARPLWAWLARGERFRIRRHKGLEAATIALFAGVFIVSMAAIGFGSTFGGSGGSGSPIAGSPIDGPSRGSILRTGPAAEGGALDLMEAVFAGGYSRSAIKQRLDSALVLYGEEITEENYSRAGSALVALSNEFGPSEMEILDYMIRSYVAGVSLTFAEAAGISTAFLAMGDQ